MNTIPITLTVSEDVTKQMTVDTAIETGGEHYEGPYTVTPTNQTQTLQTQGLIMDGVVTIDPIPSNYGLITWDGSVLTVS